MTIVEHIRTGRKAIFVGVGYGATATTEADALFGNWSHTKTEAVHQTICVADSEGTLHWAPSADFRVISVDGVNQAHFAQALGETGT